MHKISSTIVGAAGEYHVLSQLLRRGWIAALAPDGAPNMDILVTDENNQKLCDIQVKTRRDIGRDKGWHMKVKHEDLVAADLFYVFKSLSSRGSLAHPSRTADIRNLKGGDLIFRILHPSLDALVRHVRTPANPEQAGAGRLLPTPRHREAGAIRVGVARRLRRVQ